MAISLDGKKAIITGAGKGIGRATALSLAKEGVSLGLVARTETDLQKVAKELENDGVDVFIAPADVGSNEEVETAMEQLMHDLGSVDILINNAGIAKFGGF